MFRIKEARERVGLTQKELADSLGIKPSTFNGYEKGTHDPKMFTAKLDHASQVRNALN